MISTERAFVTSTLPMISVFGFFCWLHFAITSSLLDHGYLYFVDAWWLPWSPLLITALALVFLWGIIKVIGKQMPEWHLLENICIVLVLLPVLYISNYHWGQEQANHSIVPLSSLERENEGKSESFSIDASKTFLSAGLRLDLKSVSGIYISVNHYAPLSGEKGIWLVGNVSWKVDEFPDRAEDYSVFADSLRQLVHAHQRWDFTARNTLLTAFPHDFPDEDMEYLSMVSEMPADRLQILRLPEQEDKEWSTVEEIDTLYFIYCIAGACLLCFSGLIAIGKTIETGEEKRVETPHKQASFREKVHQASSRLKADIQNPDTGRIILVFSCSLYVYIAGRLPDEHLPELIHLSIMPGDMILQSQGFWYYHTSLLAPIWGGLQMQGPLLAILPISIYLIIPLIRFAKEWWFTIMVFAGLYLITYLFGIWSSRLYIPTIVPFISILLSMDAVFLIVNFRVIRKKKIDANVIILFFLFLALLVLSGFYRVLDLWMDVMIASGIYGLLLTIAYCLIHGDVLKERIEKLLNQKN